ncbi:hypothetical protein HMPREF0645_0667 [Hallella bergensis DSM 17361]|uniref:Uncharacterized protein n=1 Tax=Hallella bergensis DSM 17361 TaxID=585502 RepID=D1PUN2_9BACT|nr:hypothetical protein [Hallella bergensis]EFA44871.1 hypothetical protein HMPREF0645_0667 [Hallella bergensis DSM 17361]
MREYARIQNRNTVLNKKEETKKKTVEREVGFDINQHDITDEFTLL